MENIAILLNTPTPEFANDFCDELKLFFAVDSFFVNGDGKGELLQHSYREENENAFTSFSFRGEKEEGTAELPIGSEVELKRIRKRLCKLTLYRLLKKVTGIQPPWGSLTGVRPTRLLYARLSAGMEEAVSDLIHVFDVSPEKAELLKRIVEEQLLLPPPNEAEADVYISIPFCRTRCAYCSFPGEAVGRGKRIAPYLQALFSEMREGRRLMDRAGLKLRALYIGGGTPSALDEDDFAELIMQTKHLFPDAVEYTVEAGRPDTITRGKLETLKRFGIGRISINPQTMNDETLQAIGRCHTAEETRQAFRLARELGFDNINMDVIAALPGETPDHFAHTMTEIEKLNPDSLTVHSLAIKHSSRLNLERYPLPEGSAAAEMAVMGEESARRLGMNPYYLYRQKYMAGQQQNIGYARPGKACLYNVDIMEETTSILAFGAGAISKRVLPDHELRILRAPNVSDVETYLQHGAEMISRKSKLFLGENE